MNFKLHLKPARKSEEEGRHMKMPPAHLSD